LDPELDRHLQHEEKKIVNNAVEWKCGYCGKTFKSEDFLDKHLFRRHLNEIDSVSLSFFGMESEVVEFVGFPCCDTE
jgi:hypothetical protein